PRRRELMEQVVGRDLAGRDVVRAVLSLRRTGGHGQVARKGWVRHGPVVREEPPARDQHVVEIGGRWGADDGRISPVLYDDQHDGMPHPGEGRRGTKRERAVSTG